MNVLAAWDHRISAVDERAFRSILGRVVLREGSWSRLVGGYPAFLRHGTFNKHTWYQVLTSGDKLLYSVHLR